MIFGVTTVDFSTLSRSSLWPKPRSRRKKPTIWRVKYHGSKRHCGPIPRDPWKGSFFRLRNLHRSGRLRNICGSRCFRRSLPSICHDPSSTGPVPPRMPPKCRSPNAWPWAESSSSSGTSSWGLFATRGATTADTMNPSGGATCFPPFPPRMPFDRTHRPESPVKIRPRRRVHRWRG